MDVRQLRYFLTIVEEGQITLAAKKLNMAQPPLSQQLKNMEEELGAKLIVRNGRKMELTEAGKILYQRGINLLHEFDETVMEVKETGGGLQGSLSIGTTMSCVSYLPRRIRYFSEKYPNITLTVWSGDPYRLGEHLQDRGIELAIVRSPIDADSYSMIHLENEPFVFIMPAEWETTPSQTKIDMKEIAGLPLLLLHRIYGEGAYELVMNEFKRLGLNPHIVCHSPEVTILLSLVEAGVGATILPESAMFAYPKTNLKIMKIVDCGISTDTSVIWRKDSYLSKIAQHFIETFQPEKNNHQL